MKRNILFYFMMIFLVLVIVYFVSLGTGLPELIRADIIQYIADQVDGEISFGEIDLWPITAIQLKDITFVKNDSKSQFSMQAESIKLYLDLNIFAKDKSWFEIDYMELEKPFIDYSTETQLIKDNDLTIAQNINELIVENNLPEIFSENYLRIKEGQLNFKTPNTHLALNGVEAGLNFKEKNNYKVDLTGNAKLNYFSSKMTGKLADLSINGFKMQANGNYADWKLDFKTTAVRLKPLQKFVQTKINDLEENLVVNSLEGETSLILKLSGTKNQIKSYQAQLKPNQVSGKVSYQDYLSRNHVQLRSGTIYLAGPELEVRTNELPLEIVGNKLNLNGKFSGQTDYFLEVFAESFELAELASLNLIEEKLAGKVNLQFQLEDNKQGNPAFQLALNGEKIRLGEIELRKMLTELSYQNQEFWLEKGQFDLAANGSLRVQGSYHLNDHEYLADIIATDLQRPLPYLASLPQELSAKLDQLKNSKLNFTMQVAGSGTDYKQVSATGKADLRGELINPFGESRLATDFWYERGQLFLSDSSLQTKGGQLDLTGSIDFTDQQLDLRFVGQSISLELLELAGLKKTEINGKLEYVSGVIEKSLASPLIKADLKTSYLKIDDYQISDLEGQLEWEDQRLAVNQLDLKLADAPMQARGVLSFKNEPSIKGKVKVIDMQYEQLSKLLAQELPMEGSFTGQIELDGLLREPQAEFDLTSEDTALLAAGEKISVERLDISASRSSRGVFLLKEVFLKSEQIVLEATGKYSELLGMEIDYNLKGVEIARFIENQALTGELELRGSINGKLADPLISGELTTANLNYQKYQLQLAENQITYQNGDLNLKKFNFNLLGNMYQLQGKVVDLLAEQKLAVIVRTEQANLREHLLKMGVKYPLKRDAFLSGQAHLKGSLNNPSAKLDLKIIVGENEENNLRLNGLLAKKLALNLETTGLQLNYQNSFSGQRVNANGKLSFAGTITGNWQKPDLAFTNNFRDLVINKTKIAEVNGKFEIDNLSTINLEQELNFAQGGNVITKGIYAFEKDGKYDLHLKADDLPANLLVALINEDYSAHGEINADLKLDGTGLKPNINGELSVQAADIKTDLPAVIKKVEGQLIFSGQEIEIAKLRGAYADGNFNLHGKLTPFAADNFWQLSLNGKNLYFEEGSLAGDFDAIGQINGPFKQPTISGELLTHDFTIGIPFAWPEDEQDKEEFFQPRLNLLINPGKNVYVKNENIEVLVETGSLNLDYVNDEISLEGELNSETGVFNYYNNRFEMIDGKAVFSLFAEENIPNLHILATTVVGGTKITVSLNGPADNMTTIFTSIPEMSEEEILRLLAGKGGLGAALSGQYLRIDEIIKGEIMRFIRNLFQTDVVDRIESDVKSSLSLDVIEIDTYQFGQEEKVFLRLGKSLTEQLYVEYSSTFNDETEIGELSFQYYLTDQTKLKGSWLGDDEYSISIEKTIKF